MLVSSHQLAEVQLTCDSVAIVDRGRTIAAGPVDEVLRLGGSTGLLVRVDDLAHGSAALAAAGFDVSPAGAHLRVAAPPTAGADVTRALAIDRPVGLGAAHRGSQPRGPLPRDDQRIHQP